MSFFYVVSDKFGEIQLNLEMKYIAKSRFF